MILTRVNDLSEGFRADLGYLTRTGLTQIRSSIEPLALSTIRFFQTDQADA